MRVLVSGSAGHLGEALVRTLKAAGHSVRSLDINESAFTTDVGDLVDASWVRRCMQEMDAVLHTATLHKPHVATHSKQAFIDTNITASLNLLEAAVAAHVKAFVFTSTTSTFGDSMRPAPGTPAVWVNEDLRPRAKNIYGATKTAAEDLCRLFYRNHDLPCIVLRTSRFFPEADDDTSHRRKYSDDNLKINEFLHRRVDITDVVAAHRLAIEKAPELGFDTFIISATTPFARNDARQLGDDAAQAVSRRVPEFEEFYAKRGWLMYPNIGRVYDNAHARHRLGWNPKMNFSTILERYRLTGDWRSDLARSVGSKGYHDQVFADGPFPVD